MQLLTKTVEERLRKNNRPLKKDPLVVEHFFNPTGGQDWYVISYHPRERNFFGYVSLFHDPMMDELGYFSLAELEEFKGPFGLGIERDLHWEPRPLSEVRKMATPSL